MAGQCVCALGAGMQRLVRRQTTLVSVTGVGPVLQNDTLVTLPWVGIYIFGDTPALVGEGKEIARYEGDRTKHLQTTWTEDTIQRMIDWGAKYGSRIPGLLEYTATLAEVRR